jgi:hypothetical protein
MFSGGELFFRGDVEALNASEVVVEHRPAVE